MSGANSYQHGGDHYRKPVQVWDFIALNGIPYLEGNAIKYLSRWRDKGGIEDLKKARHYVDKLIELEETARAVGTTVSQAPDRPPCKGVVRDNCCECDPSGQCPSRAVFPTSHNQEADFAAWKLGLGHWRCQSSPGALLLSWLRRDGLPGNVPHVKSGEWATVLQMLDRWSPPLPPGKTGTMARAVCCNRHADNFPCDCPYPGKLWQERKTT